MERQLVHTRADISWVIHCASAHENHLLFPGFRDHADKIDTGIPEVHSALAVALALQARTKALANVAFHRDRLSRHFDRSLRQLRTVQAECRGLE